MRFAGLVSVICLILAGCASSNKVVEARSVKQMPPGYGVMLATFKYVPGQNKYPSDQILYDAKYTALRLAELGYQPFIVYRGGTSARVGIRASSHTLAAAMKKEIDRTNVIDLKDGRKLKVVKTEIINLAELQLGSMEEIR